jgi:hypothetical protein
MQDLDMAENINIKIVSKEEMVLKVQSQELTSGGMIAALFYGYFMPTVNNNNSKNDMHRP